MTDNPQGIIEEQMLEGITHPYRHGLRREETKIDQISDRQQEEWNIWHDRTPQKSGSDNLELLSIFFVDGSIND